MDSDVFVGDCREVLTFLPDNSVDAIVTDPPYDLTAQKRGGSGEKSLNLNSPAGRSRITTGFMGKAWDGTGVAFDPATWEACLRVLKPGGHLLAFGGTRTYHRMTCAIEDAGFEIRDCLQWLYGTGFPKSLNAGDGRGTALKPAYEPIVMARKPLIGTVEKNLAAHGTGVINIDACRIGFGSEADKASAKPQGRATTKAHGAAAATPDAGRGIERIDFEVKQSDAGRWPANVLLDDEASAMLDEQTGELTTGGGRRNAPKAAGVLGAFAGDEPSREFAANKGGASRFFYVAKPSRSERDAGVAGAAKSGGELTDRTDGSAGLNSPRAGAGRTSGGKNIHPTVKPVTLLRYLVKLVTPPGGTVLDPFCGSGTTGMAAMHEDRDFIGIEMSEEYAEIARQRIAFAVNDEAEAA